MKISPAKTQAMAGALRARGHAPTCKDSLTESFREDSIARTVKPITTINSGTDAAATDADARRAPDRDDGCRLPTHAPQPPTSSLPTPPPLTPAQSSA